MPRNLVLLSAVLLSACLLGGCVTAGLYETARTAPPGRFEFGGTLTPVFVSLDSVGGGLAYYPYPELYSRVGLGDNFDMGIRWAFGPGVGLDGKYRFLSVPDGVEAAARLGASFYGLFLGGAGVGFYTLSPRVVVSREPESGLPWTFNAGADYFGAFASGEGGGAGAGLLNLKAGAGLPFRVFGSLRIMPEVGISLPLVGSFYTSVGEMILLSGEGHVLMLGVCVGSVANDEETSGGRWKP